MSIGVQLAAWARRRKARRRSGVEAAASLRRIETFEASRLLEGWRAQHVADNPLLAFGRKQFSQNDEDGLIDEIVRRVRGSAPGSFLELGVGDGCENNTLNLLAQGWRGAWLGGEGLRLASTGPRLTFRPCWIDRDTVLALAREALDAQRIGQPDLLSIDLDGNDHHLCRTLLDGGLVPAVWVLEYNARFGPAAHWVMPYRADHRWSGDDYFGASLRAYRDLLDGAGYRLVACNLTGANAFFVRNEYASAFADVPADWQRLYMPPRYLAYPWFGHPPGVATIESLLAA